MMRIDMALAALLFAASALFTLVRIRSYLHIFQQEEYDTGRFLPWLVRSRAFDRRLSIAIILITVPLALLPGGWALRAAMIGVSVAMVVVARVEQNPLQAAKKKLVLTARAKRLFLATAATSGLCFAAFIAASTMRGLPLAALILPVQLIPLLLCLSTILFEPFEARMRTGYRKEAQAKLVALAPTIIGVTGSFGKTSVKHILGHMLAMMAPTLITPGSVNTEMGISRIVRETLLPEHRYFVVEMGAYGIGSIARLCRLAPPQLSILTAIGPAHYERFGSLENVVSAKLEIAEAALALHGKVVIESDTLSFEKIRDLAADNAGAIVISGESPGAQAHIESVVQDKNGITCSLQWQGERYTLRAPLYGLHHCRNIALAFAAACTLGFEPAKCAIALRTTPQISHRLEVKPQPGGWTLIDDAYNSNPAGFESGLQVLDMLCAGTSRRILITPGMVELGDMHESEHRRLGVLAAASADILVIIGAGRIPSFAEGFRSASLDRPIQEFAVLQDALVWLNAHVQPGDVVLLENDLPDLYERALRI